MARVHLAALAITLVGCVSTSGPSRISNYQMLEGHLNETVVLSGYWSKQHEATGIYFGSRDYFDAPGSCVAVDSTVNAPHASRIKLTGTVEKSACGTELICTTVCQPYILRHTQQIK
ncbi:hypothetical protein [Blastomonas sp. AAP53]|uniref:hypothetical protein n=1 Tax=Blastomonas sp. AAP53 TaxID=1248760 RepID=UPI001266F886|nr:hypothetical protein [Blastomonas sp. AAP53]